MWKLPFSLYADITFMKQTMEIDCAIRSLGVTVDYGKKGILALACSLSQVVVYFARTLCICVTLNNLNMDIPYERIFQVVFCDSLALILSGHYCYYLYILIEKYAMLNKVLRDIKSQQAWEYTMFIRDKPNIEKGSVLQEKYICRKIGTCAKIYCMLYKTTAQVSMMYGIGLVLTTSLGLNTAVLYLFYFMEATASGLFKDLQRYIYFLFYVFWQTAYATGIIFMTVFFSEMTVSEVSLNSLKDLTKDLSVVYALLLSS
ncbi:unnamed protein product [Diatraea saccharalis]|uniref:Gustatory receptor n=1 Tax=Diatraea saccharalis TaxID=40085 RepID=A0A9N9WBC3_9NEOP|nr:unnamed protein product [Diatraea saccharalis]